MQAKRIQLNHVDVPINVQVNVALTVPDEPKMESNFHNIWMSVSHEPENADANYLSLLSRL